MTARMRNVTLSEKVLHEGVAGRVVAEGRGAKAIFAFIAG